MKKTLLKRFTSVTLATALIGTMGVAAFAEDVVNNSGAAADSYLMKYLEVGEGITIPDETFTFTFTQTKYNGETTYADTYKAPITAVTMKTTDSGWTKTNDADDEASIYQKKSMADILANTTFPAAGVYTYTVAETKGSTDGFTYDEHKYVLNVYVKNDGTKTVEVKKSTDGTTEGEKVDVKKTDPTKDTEETGTSDGNVTVQGFTFDNQYKKTNKKTDDNTEGYLNISKTVKGAYGDQTYGFEFAITLTAPRLAAADAKAKYSIYDAAGNKTGTGTMTYGTAQEFALKHGETLRFYEIEAGTKYSVTEKLATSSVTKADQYTASAVANVGGNGVTVGTVEEHEDLTVGTYVIDDDTATLDDVAYTNTFDDDSVSPTGILINNAPYIILALVAAGGMTFYVVKKRKEN